ncbi:MAG: UDP-glucose 4-epimerase GalE [Alphaproteobacteria bacterium]|nr:UDP-glucose 4-epimerase GalE [Alphaproteobacteria bacterium]
MTVLVTGGAGYIGSHMCLALLEQGEDVVVLDNLSTGLRELVPSECVFVKGCVGDEHVVRGILARHDIDAVIHFAGATVVPESVERPFFYYRNNTAATRNFLETVSDHGVGRVVFSSTAAVYGTPESGTVAETAPTAPASPYGRSKLMTEWMLEDGARAGAFRYVALRYFNVAGADPEGRTGQSTPRATHLIKLACQAALGRVPHLGIFGTDYPTPDGTGVRDYIHVSDLVVAHLLALRHLRRGGESGVFNCGYGTGYSVREIVAAVERAADCRLAVREMPRRPGDLASVVADPGRLKARLGWTPRFDDIDAIVGSALAWERGLALDGTVLSPLVGRPRTPALQINYPT